MRPFPASKLSWWVCRVCNRVRVYTASDSLEIPGKNPVCTSCADGAGRFMQKLEFGTDISAEPDVGRLTDRDRQIDNLKQIIVIRDGTIRYLNGVLDTREHGFKAFEAELSEYKETIREDANTAFGVMNETIDDLNAQLTEKRAINNEITRLRVNEVERTEALKAELSARKEDSKVLIEVANVIKRWNNAQPMGNYYMMELLTLVKDYLNAPEPVIIDEGKPEVTALDHETYSRVISALRTDVDDRDKHIEGLESDIRELRASRGRQTETIRDLMNDLQQKDMVTIQLVEKLASHDETIRVMRNTNGALDRNLQDRNVRLDHMRDVVDNPRGRSFQAIVERISNIIREDEP